jgi:glutamate N-acetyltransferase/amino-acid N-acetyltransferase
MAVGLKPLEKLLPVPGTRVAVANAGLRYRKRADLAVLLADEGTSTAAVFTRNRFAAAPVLVAREHMETAAPRALVVNSGQANAGTGEPGLALARDACAWVAGEIGCAPEQVLPFSTGVIGVVPPSKAMRAAISGLCRTLSEDAWNEFAEAIVTTDTVPKGVSIQLSLGDATVTLSGVAKGSGMIRPDMATMLAFVATDASIDTDVLQHALSAAVDVSFNRITVDGDTSTNDACVLMATGRAANETIDGPNHPLFEPFRAALTEVCTSLAKMIVRDGEGATKFVAIEVGGGRTVDECLQVAYTIAHSPLVKTALFASDPNWGRILAAVGRAPVVDLAIDQVELDINGVAVVRNGAVADSYSEEEGQQAMAREEIHIEVRLGAGKESATVWTTDLSHEYVRINAEYRS